MHMGGIQPLEDSILERELGQLNAAEHQKKERDLGGQSTLLKSARVQAVEG